MTYYADLANTTQIDSGPLVRAIGWLSAGHPFSRGVSPPEFVEKLRALCARWARSTEALGWPAAGGPHRCDFCATFMAAGNLGVPAENVLFVAPEMVIHYVEAHQYSPPQAFIDAVMACPLPGTPEYGARAARFVQKMPTPANGTHGDMGRATSGGSATSDESRREALRILRELLSIDGPNLDALLEAANRALGVERLRRCVSLIRESPLTRRSHALACVAALVVGTRELGGDWWRRQHRRSDGPGRPEEGPPPEDLLVASRANEQRQWPTTLERLAQWAAADVADALWGPPVDAVDLNSLAPDDRIALPPNARAGDRLVVSFDPGSRVDALVLARPDGTLGSVLDLESVRHSAPAEVEWGWGISAGLGPHRLPDEDEGGPDDPYHVLIDEAAAATLSAWAIAHGADVDQILPPWTVAGDPIRALGAVDLVRRDGTWFAWGRATEALANRDAQRLAQAISTLGPP